MEFLFLLTEGHLNPYFKKILLLKIGTNIIYIDKLKKIILDLSFNYTEKILRIKKGVINSFIIKIILILVSYPDVLNNIH